ncbi:Uncharacterized protein PCOAH_00053380 [Plasmodium coatneyi]|uniref:Helicase n=1 Tax=Plasmodium coatneyi TaxID=208452 RepID=A0A1B1E7A2_9APIC|nr:Uncharacterized protein PCOAH_00053380 [Plasmodium coatneyi]ANQ10885.1 Uncharacterized protein PCOAH_00053380 [Plasmodium coatneyi]
MNPYTIKRTYECLYTHQKIQKSKKWQEGYCEVIASYGGIKMNLLNQSRTCIESSLSCETSFNNMQEEIELPKHLIQFVDVTNYAEDVIQTDTSRKRRTLCTSQNEGTVHTSKSKKITAHSGVNSSKEFMGSQEASVDIQNDPTTFDVQKTDRYIRVNRKFEMPRRIKKKAHVEEGEATQYLEDDHSGEDSSEGEFPDMVKKKNSVHRIAPRNKPHQSDNDERISVSYTNIRNFNKNKKNIKWYDGFLVKKNDLLELYNNSEGRLYIRSADESIQQEEYIQFGNYIVYNDFYVHPAKNQQENLKTNDGRINGMFKNVGLTHGGRTPAQLHQVLRRKGNSEGDTNACEEADEEVDCEETNEEVDPASDNNSPVNLAAPTKRQTNDHPDGEAVSLFNKYVTTGEELPSCLPEEKLSLMDISPSRKKKLRRDDRSGESDSPGEASSEEHHINDQRGDKHQKNNHQNERHRWDKMEFPLYKNRSGRSAAYLCCSRRQKVNTYDEITNIARVVSRNNFSCVNPHRNIIRLNLGIKLLSMGVPREFPALPPPGGEDSGHDRNCHGGIVKRQPCWSCTNGENKLCWNDRNSEKQPYCGGRNGEKQLCLKDRNNEKRPCGSSTEANSNGKEAGEAPTSEAEWDTKKSEQHVQVIPEVIAEIIPDVNCLEDAPKLESIERAHPNPYEIKSLKNFASTNSRFDASQVDQVRRQNLFLPIYITILKEKEDLKKKIQKMKFQSIPNFFLNKLEYIYSFMNATLFQIQYQVLCKLLCLHDYLVPLLCEMRGDYLKGGNPISHRKMLHNVDHMRGQYLPSRSDDALPSESRDVQAEQSNEEGSKRRKYNQGEDDYTLFIQNVEVLCSSEEESRTMFGENEQQSGNLNWFDGETNIGEKRFFIRRTEREVLLVNKKKKNKLTKEDDINKYVHMNHLIVMGKDIPSESYQSYASGTSTPWVKDKELLLFVSKWNNFRQNYLEIYPLNVSTFSYMNETFQDEEIIKSREYLYFLKDYKVKVFPSCLFLVNLGNHLDNLKHLFFFHQNLEKEKMVPQVSALFSSPFVHEGDTQLHLDMLLRQIGIRTSAWGSSYEFIDLHNVGITYMDDLLSRIRQDEQLNERQKWVIECMLGWFRCGGEKKEKWEKDKTCETEETISSTGERSEAEMPSPSRNGSDTPTHRGNSILVNGIFGSGKSTLICKAILYLDKVLTQEERAARRGKAAKGKEKNQQISLRNGHLSSPSGGSEEKSSDKTNSPPTQIEHRRCSDEKKKKILLMCNTNLAVDNILLKLKFHFDFHDYARIGNIFEINFFLITNFISINSNDQKKALEVRNYIQGLARSTNSAPNNCDPTVSDSPTISGSPSFSGSVSPSAETKLHKIKDMDKLVDALMKKNSFVFRNKFRNKRIIAGTCKSLQIYEKLSSIRGSTDYLIVDECTQIDELTLFQFFLKFQIRKFLLIGDVKQLGVVLKSPSDLRRSMFSRLVENELFIAHHLGGTNIVSDQTAPTAPTVGVAVTEDEVLGHDGIIDRIVNRVRSMHAAEYSALKSYLYDNMFALHGGDTHTYEGNHVIVENAAPQSMKGEDYPMRRAPPRAGINHLILMNEQFRCHPEISSICSHLFYNGLIKNAKCTETIPLMYKRYGSHVNFILLKKAPQEVTFRSSFTNGAEAKVILSLCENMIGSSIDPDQIGIISLFRNQAFYIKNKMKESRYYERLRNVKVSTVDSFQGIEKDIILFSCVLGEVTGINRVGRFHHDQPADSRDDYFQAFCNNRNRINVALSRARSQLIIVAQSSFVEGNRVWSYIKSQAKVYHVEGS